MAKRATEDDAPPAARGGSRALAAVAVVSVTYLTVLPAVLAGLIYLFLSVYAVVKISPPGHPNPTVVLLGVAFLVAMMAILFGVTVWLIGRAFEPKKQKKH